MQPNNSTADQQVRDQGSRRQLLLAGGLAAAGLLAACGSDKGPGGVGTREAARDVGVVNSVLALENAIMAAYRDGLGLLRGDLRALMSHVIDQEREHAASLARAVVELGGTPARPKSREEYRVGFPRMREADDVLRFAVDLEELSVKRYEDAVARLTRPQLRQTAAAIAASEAAHLSMALTELGRDPAPEAFVTGKS